METSDNAPDGATIFDWLKESEHKFEKSIVSACALLPLADRRRLLFEVFKKISEYRDFVMDTIKTEQKRDE